MNISDKIKLLEKLSESGDIRKASDFKKEIEVIPSGSLALDAALGVGGYLKGTIIDIFGPYSSGKSLLSLLAIREVIKLGGIAVVADAERSYKRSQEWMKVNGVDPSKVYLLYKNSGEEYLDKIYEIIKSKAADLVIVDSVPALVPQCTIDRKITAGQKVGANALMMSQALQKLVPVIDDSKVVCIFINQLRSNISMNPYQSSGDDEGTGGNALRFYASIRINVKKIGGSDIKQGNAVLGHRVRIKIKKNKLAAPFKTGEFKILYEGGIDRIEELADILTKSDIVEQEGGWISDKQTKERYHGIAKFTEMLKDEAKFKYYFERLKTAKIELEEDADISEEDLPPIEMQIQQKQVQI